MPSGAQVKRDRLTIIVERRGISSGIALRHLSRPRLHVRSAKDHTVRETAPRGVGLWGRTLKTIRAEGARGGPTQAPVLITTEEPRVLIIVGGQSVDFLLDTGAAYSVLTEAPGPLSSPSISIMGLSGRAKRHNFSYSLSCNWDSVLFSHEFLIVPESPSPLLGRDPTPVLLPGKSHGQRSLVGCSPWVAQRRTRLSDFPFTFHFHALEKEMATLSSVFAWRIPGTGEPGGLPSMGSHRVGHDWSDLAA